MQSPREERTCSLVCSVVASKNVGWSGAVKPSSSGELCILSMPFRLCPLGSRELHHDHLASATLYPIEQLLSSAVTITMTLPHAALCFNILSDIFLASDTIVSVSLTNVIQHVLGP